MRVYGRRTFIKYSAMTAAAVAGHVVSPAAQKKPCTPNGQPVSAHPFFAHAQAPDVIAHRGGDGQWPGETMLAMRKARTLGADVLEMDVYVTKDRNAKNKYEHLVLMHDNTVGNTTDVAFLKRLNPVHSFTLSELQQLNAAYRWSPGGGKEHPYQVKFGELPQELQRDLRVPTLAEVFDEFHDMRMVVEMKWWPGVPSPAEALSDLIKERGMEEKVLVASFSHSFLEQFRELSKGKVATSASVKEVIDYKGKKGLRPNAQAIQLTPQIVANIKGLKLELLDRDFVDKAHDDKLAVHAWTINNVAEMRRLRDELCIDGIITDYPEALLGVLGRAATV